MRCVRAVCHVCLPRTHVRRVRTGAATRSEADAQLRGLAADDAVRVMAVHKLRACPTLASPAIHRRRSVPPDVVYGAANPRDVRMCAVCRVPCPSLASWPALPRFWQTALWTP